MLQIFDLGDDLLGVLVFRIEIDAHLLRFGEDVALSRQFGDEHTLTVAHELGSDVFVRSRIAKDRGDMDAAFVSERGVSDVGLIDLHMHVGNLADIAGGVGELLQPVRLEHIVTKLEL
ncbi:hypothetical protein D3C81_1284060 [compost metagenome]